MPQPSVWRVARLESGPVTLVGSICVVCLIFCLFSDDKNRGPEQRQGLFPVMTVLQRKDSQGSEVSYTALVVCQLCELRASA